MRRAHARRWSIPFLCCFAFATPVGAAAAAPADSTPVAATPVSASPLTLIALWCPRGTHVGYEGKYCWPDERAQATVRHRSLMASGARRSGISPFRQSPPIANRLSSEGVASQARAPIGIDRTSTFASPVGRRIQHRLLSERITLLAVS